MPGLAGLQCLFQSFRWGQIRHIRYLIQFIVIQSCCAPGGHQKEGPWVLEPDEPNTRRNECSKGGRTIVKRFDLTQLLTFFLHFSVSCVVFSVSCHVTSLLKLFAMTQQQYPNNKTFWVRWGSLYFSLWLQFGYLEQLLMQYLWGLSRFSNNLRFIRNSNTGWFTQLCSSDHCRRKCFIHRLILHVSANVKRNQT